MHSRRNWYFLLGSFRPMLCKVSWCAALLSQRPPLPFCGAGNPSMGGKLLPRDPLAAFVAKYVASTSLGLVASYELHLFDGALGANGIVI